MWTWDFCLFHFSYIRYCESVWANIASADCWLLPFCFLGPSGLFIQKNIFREWPLLWIRVLLPQHVSPHPQGSRYHDAGYRGVVPGRLRVLLGMASPRLPRAPLKQLYPRCHISTPKHWEGRAVPQWEENVGWDGEWDGAWKGVVFPARPCQHPAFLCWLGFTLGATPLWVVSIAKKRSKPRDNLGEWPACPSKFSLI